MSKSLPVSFAPADESHRLGEMRTFVLAAEVRGKPTRVRARLVGVGGHTYIWDEDGDLSRADISRLLARFDRAIYARNMKYFADRRTEKQIGRVNILLTDLGDADGYFNPVDLTAGNRLSLIYLNPGTAKNKPALAEATLAHELAHLIYFAGGGADIEWLDEGLAVYAEYINGHSPKNYILSYRQMPGVKLSREEFMPTGEFYGAAFLFVAFAADKAEKSGSSVPDFLQALIRNSRNGPGGVDGTLRQYIDDARFDSFTGVYRQRQLAGFGKRVGEKI